MAILKIRQLPDPILRQKLKPLDEITDEDRRLALDMVETMFFAEGVGLAANQVGIEKRIIVISPANKRGEETVIFNPRILKQEGELRDKEGCLSVPGFSAEVTRSRRLTLKGLTFDGESKVWELEGFPAVVAQHEVDHINGILYIDRLSFWQRRKIERQFLQKQKTCQP